MSPTPEPSGLIAINKLESWHGTCFLFGKKNISSRIKGGGVDALGAAGLPSIESETRNMTSTTLAVDPSIKSRPAYRPEASLPEADDILCVIPPAGRERLVALLGETGKAGEARVRVLIADDAEAGAVSYGPLPGAVTESRGDVTHRLPELLAASTVGCRLVVIGSEAFLWDVRGLAIEGGMVDQEISLYPLEAQGRRVFCVHCRNLTEGVAVSPMTCAGCGLRLEVRDHFSRRLGAYMGVCIDAEAPGVIPPQEEIA